MELNKIYNESNLQTMARMPNCFVDYSLTSPPYNVSALNTNFEKYSDFSDNLSNKDYFETQSNLISELLRVTKKHVFYNIQMVSGNKSALHKLIGAFSEKIKEVIIWEKGNGFGQPAISEKVFNSAFEYIIIFSNLEPEKRYFSDATFERGTQSNIFKIKNKHSNDYSDVHKAVMTLDIPRYFMQIFGSDNDIWFDPYSGTGTTVLAAIIEKKRYLASEISKEYFDLSEKRIKNHIDQLTLF